MAHYSAEISWHRDGADFADNLYRRHHLLRFEGGLEVPGSSSPHVVPLPMSDASALDPEAAFVASLSSCHMLWFLDFARQHKLVVDHYLDRAEGVLASNAAGKMAMTQVTLRPDVTFSPASIATPTRALLDTLHHAAHDACFIASSVLTDVRCEPVYGRLPDA